MKSLNGKKWNGKVYKDVVYFNNEQVKVNEFAFEQKQALISLVELKKADLETKSFMDYGFKTVESFEKAKSRLNTMIDFISQAKDEDVIYLEEGLTFCELHAGFTTISKVTDKTDKPTARIL